MILQYSSRFTADNRRTQTERSTIYSISTPEHVTVTQTSTSLVTAEESSTTTTTEDEHMCSESVVTEFVTVTVTPSAAEDVSTVTEWESEDDSPSTSISYYTVTEFATDAQTLTEFVTTDVMVTVTEASGQDGISYTEPESSPTPVATTTTWITFTDGEPVTSTSVVIIAGPTPSINATVVIYPPGVSGNGTYVEPSPSIPVIVSGGTKGADWSVFSSMGRTALAIAVIACMF